MALVKFGAGVSEMRGKEGGIIYSRNASGAYIKTKVTPTNPQSEAQQTVRARLQSVSQAWNGLTGAQQSAWDALGDQVTRVNVFGDSLPYTGFSLYMRLNLNLLAIGQSTLSTPPTVPSIPELAIGALTAESGTEALSYTFTPSLSSSGLTLVTYATGNILTGRKFVKNLRRVINVSSEASNPINILTGWQAKFGSLIEGATIFIAAKLVDEASGFDGSLVVASDVVEAGA